MIVVDIVCMFVDQKCYFWMFVGLGCKLIEFLLGIWMQNIVVGSKIVLYGFYLGYFNLFFLVWWMVEYCNIIGWLCIYSFDRKIVYIEFLVKFRLVYFWLVCCVENVKCQIGQFINRLNLLVDLVLLVVDDCIYQEIGRM